MIKITDMKQLNRFLEENSSGDCLIYKHSYRCGLCIASMEEVEAFQLEQKSCPVCIIDVVKDRELSLALADTLNVLHQSPQAILIRDGKVLWNASHQSVTCKAMTAQVVAR